MASYQAWTAFFRRRPGVFDALNGRERSEAMADRWCGLLDHHAQGREGEDIRCFSVPGRSEIGGNHTDHNHGRVLAASVTVDTITAVTAWDKPFIEINSLGFGDPFRVSLENLAVRPEDCNTTSALIRGVAERMAHLGHGIGGFRATMGSEVLPGSGLSSSAAFEVMVATILDALYNGGRLTALEKAVISRYAENVHFGKPSGLMDQLACAHGGMIAIDFHDIGAPDIREIPFDFTAANLYLAVTNTGGSHEDLTGEYAAIFEEMSSAAAFFGAEVLREVAPEIFFQALPQLRQRVGDRAALRAAHFIMENERVLEQTRALEAGDIDTFLKGVIASGESSAQWLQNCFVAGSREQGIPIALLESKRMLEHAGGAWRLQGGGFAGTIEAFVPGELREDYRRRMDELFGPGACNMLAIRSMGAVELEVG